MIGFIGNVRLLPGVVTGIGVTLALAAAGCAGSPGPSKTARSPVSASEMSAAENRAAASLQEGLAASSVGTTDPSFPGEASAPYADRVTGRQDAASETTSGLRVTRARQYTKHANEHRQTADLLETFEASECTRSPHQNRAMCPILEEVVRVENTRTGVRLFLIEGADTERVLNHMRCHHAFGKARGFSDMESCPLYLKEIRIREVRPGTIEITSGRPGMPAEIQRRSRGHVVEEPPALESAGDTP
ncbi:MAG: hypothetical protein KJO57_09510 [Deltaproteobacteria bacterium]|nr:hypothetical protein [Deltaproteobacteria bacterium]